MSHKIIPSTFGQFVDATKQAIERFKQGNATNDDIAQIGYAAQHGKMELAKHGYPGYKATYAEQEQLMNEVEGIVEDSHNFDSDDPFTGWTLYM